jgi:hypothetical protein
MLRSRLPPHLRQVGASSVPPGSAAVQEAERLEQLRLEYLEGMPMAEFHRLLTESGEYAVSYAAVRNYHTGRKAPVDYYAHVCRVFGVRLEWLLFGEGEMTPSLQLAREERVSSPEWTDSLPRVAPTIWDPADQITQAAFLECLQRLELARPGGRTLSAKQRENLARVLDTLVGGILWILRGDKEIPRSFVQLILLAVSEAIPEPGKGSTYQDILKRMKMRDEGG